MQDDSMQDDDNWQRNAFEAAPPNSPRPSMTPEHSPIRWPLCPDRACRRHRRCAMQDVFCANPRWLLPRTDAAQDKVLARMERMAGELLRQRGMQV